MNKALVKVKVRISNWSGNVLDDRTTKWLTDREKASRDSAAVVLRLLPRGSKKKIDQNGRDMHTLIFKNGLPFEDGGWRIMPQSVLATIEPKLQKLLIERDQIVSDMCDSYETIKAAAKVRMGNLWNEDAFPTQRSFLRRFKALLQKGPVFLPDQKQLCEIYGDNEGAEIAKQELERLKETMSSAMLDLADEVRRAVKHLSSRCAENSKGTKYGKMMKSLTELASKTERLNITDSKEMENVTARIKRLASLHPDTLHGSKNIRAVAVSVGKEIVDLLDASFAKTDDENNDPAPTKKATPGTVKTVSNKVADPDSTPVVKKTAAKAVVDKKHARFSGF
jgi:hypothetical protein